MIFILLAFLMGQTGRWKDDDLVYDLVNFIGSALLVVYAVAGNAVPFIVLNSIWAVYSLYDVVQDMRKQYGKKYHLLKPKRVHRN